MILCRDTSMVGVSGQEGDALSGRISGGSKSERGG